MTPVTDNVKTLHQFFVDSDQGYEIARVLNAHFCERAQVGFEPYPVPGGPKMKIWLWGWNIESEEITSVLNPLPVLIEGFRFHYTEGFENLDDEALARQLAQRFGMDLERVLAVIRSEDPVLGRAWAIEQLP